jgi:serine/threonine protein kinase
MALILGSKLGPYEVLSRLGAGGMGEVYRARDPRLNREVAIKVLPADSMADEDRRRRFTQEARAASALNHPNIVTVHEVDCVEGIDFIVMEYMVGKTLDQVIPRQGMRLGEVLRMAIPIADALARAHAAGIVHRDLKPANVMVGDEGWVKVLDFGLAKLITPKGTGPKRETETESRPGTAGGTTGYMSPEQAAGGKVDTRSDVFSFGALLYEMATGRRAFAGSSTAEVLAALMRDQPKAPSEVVPELPEELDRLIQRCLRKEPERRFQHMLDAKLELEQIKGESESGRAAARPARRRRLQWVGAGIAMALVLATATGLWRRSREVPLEPPRLVSLTSMSGSEEGATLSPDGEWVAFTWNGERQDNFDIYVKMIGSSEMHRLTTDPAMDIMPNWSPDGRQIAFVRLGPNGPRIHLISPLGGSDRKLSDFPLAFARPAWSPDGRWLAVPRDPSAKETGTDRPGSNGLYLLPSNGGEPRALRIPQEAGDISAATFAPDGRHLAYVSGLAFSQHIAVVDLGSDYMPTGAPRSVTRRVIVVDGGLAWTRDGKSLLYGESGNNRLWRVEITGDRAPQPVEIAGFGAIRPATAASSDRLVFVKKLTDLDIYRFEVGRAAEPVITSSFADFHAQFSPDGRRVAFESERSGEHEIWLAEADGSSPTLLTHKPGLRQGSPCWSPDGLRLAFDSKAEEGGWDIWTIAADGASPRRLTQGPGDEHAPSWSRDGRFVYFAAEGGSAASQRGPFDIWRVPAAGGAQERITQGGGRLAHESIDGKTLFYMRSLSPSPLLALPLGGGPEREVAKCVASFAVGPAGLYSLECPDAPPQASLFVRDPATGQGRLLGKLERAVPAGLTVSPDGKTILFAKLSAEGSDLMMIENFR